MLGADADDGDSVARSQASRIVTAMWLVLALAILGLLVSQAIRFRRVDWYLVATVVILLEIGPRIAARLEHVFSRH
jgi:hypothetical protein